MTEKVPSIFDNWFIHEKPRHFVLGHVFSRGAELNWANISDPARKGVGRWECDLVRNDALTWSDEVYDLFGFSRGSEVARDDAAARYCNPSRDIMERLRSYAIGHSSAFILDAQIQPGNGECRWMRLIAEPVVQDKRVVRLRGIKLAL
jgi:hypothetical protein